MGEEYVVGYLVEVNLQTKLPAARRTEDMMARVVINIWQSKFQA
jgi:hypothetical protein